MFTLSDAGASEKEKSGNFSIFGEVGGASSKMIICMISLSFEVTLTSEYEYLISLVITLTSCKHYPDST